MFRLATVPNGGYGIIRPRENPRRCWVFGNHGKLMGRNRALGDLLRWLDSAPQGTTLSAASVREVLAEIEATDPVDLEPEPRREAEYEPTWRERLWVAPAETRIGVAELTEALGRPKSWVYRHTSAKTIPHRKLDGELLFIVGEVRAWMREREDIEAAGPMESTRGERSGRPFLKAS